MISQDQERIARLLGQGIEAHRVASATGVDPSYISQLLADDEFKERVQELRLASLTEATTRDGRYAKIEDKLLDRIETDIDNNPLALKTTTEKIRALAMMNGLKRRGAGVDENITQINQTVVQLILPTSMAPRFITDANNHIVQAGDKSLLTMQSKSLEVLANESSNTNGASTSKPSNRQLQYYE